jgi:hypothetical protein
MTVPSVARPRTTLSLSPFLLVILVLALVLRVWGISWALPDVNHLFSYHVDETVVVTYSRTVNPLLLHLDPGFYNYGSLSLLLNGLVIHLGEWTGLVQPGPVPEIYSASTLLLARLLTVALGTATCAFLFGAGRLAYHRNAGIVAALCYAVAPLAVQHGHFATVDVPATFWVTGSLYFAIRHLSAEKRSRDLLWSGLWAGLATATKYNMALVLLSGVVAWWLSRPRDGKGIVTLLAASLLGFLVGCPGVFLNTKAFITGLTDEMIHVGKGHDKVFTGTPSGFIYHLGFNLGWGIGLPLVIVSVVAVGLALYRRRPVDLVILAFTIPYYILIGLAAVKFARYTLPLLPPFFLLVGGLLPVPEQKGFRIVAPIIGLSTLFALLLACGFDSVMMQTDPRDQAAAFIHDKGFTSVGFATGPWFNSPPLSPFLAASNPEGAKQAAAQNQSIRLIPADGEWNVEQLKQESPDAVSLSEINEYADAQRIRFPAAMEYLSTLQSLYPRHQVFANPIIFLGIRFSSLNTRRGLPTQNLPHDMNYTNPTTIVFYK